MKKLTYLLVPLLASLSSLSVAHAVTISMGIPGSNANTTSSPPGAFVANIYQFALMIGGVLAFGVIVYGGVKYMTSSGNPSGQSDAKEWIEAALLGLLLLVGAYFILNVVNPQLTNLNLPPASSLPQVNTQTPGGTSPTIPAPTPTPTPTPAPSVPTNPYGPNSD
jgi:Type IV secretion system pilin